MSDAFSFTRQAITWTAPNKTTHSFQDSLDPKTKESRSDRHNKSKKEIEMKEEGIK
jgi:hypothetical protein